MSSMKSRSRSRSPQRPCFIPSGILARYENQKHGRALKYAEPPNAALPKHHWRFFVFEGEDEKEPIDLHIKSCYIIGRDKKVADIIIHDNSISKEHAAIQFREKNSNILPYLIDLDSKNSSFLNQQKIECARYYEIKTKDILKFGASQIELVAIKGDRLRYRQT